MCWYRRYRPLQTYNHYAMVLHEKETCRKPYEVHYVSKSFKDFLLNLSNFLAGAVKFVVPVFSMLQSKISLVNKGTMLYN